MSGFDEHGCAWPGKSGYAEHEGEPLTVDEIKALEDGAEVVVTWPGGNGPHSYRITRLGEVVCVDNIYRDPLLTWQDMKRPLVRVTVACPPDSHP